MEKISGDFLIEICGVQVVDGERDEVNVLTEGKYFEHHGERCVSYTEYDCDNPRIFHNSMVRLMPDQNTVTVFRAGENNSRLTLEKERRHHCHYHTPLGELMMGVYTKAISSSLNDDGGELYVSYTLDFNAGYMSNNEFTIKVKRKGA